MFKWLRKYLERGQAIIEYMPTLAGAMAVTTIALIYLGGGVTNSYCQVVEAFGEEPDACVEDVDTGGSGGEEDGSDGGDGSDGDDSHDDPPEATCVVSYAGAEDGEWDGNPDMVVANVSEIGEPAGWTAVTEFNDPDKAPLEQSGEFTEAGETTIEIAYPDEGDWGAGDGAGRFEAATTITVDDPCEGVAWSRHYVAEATDLAIEVTNDHEAVEVAEDAETVVYTLTVRNNGPLAAGTDDGDGSGTMVTFPQPADTSIVSVAGGNCVAGNPTVCDLGQMDVGEEAVITVETTVSNIYACNLYGEGSVSVTSPDDTDLSNNWDDTDANCALVCPPDLSPNYHLVNASTGASIVNNLSDGAEIIDPGVNYSVVVDGVDGAGSVVLQGAGEDLTLNSGPYSIGNWSGTGSYSLNAYVWAAPDGGSPICAESGIGFDIIEEPAPACDAAIDGFSWVNTYTGDVNALNDGDTIELDTRDAFTIVANASGSTVGSVALFAQDGTISRVDNDAEFSLTEDSGNSFQPWDRNSDGTVIAQVYDGPNGTGEMCDEQTVSFKFEEASEDERVFEHDPGCPASHPVTELVFDRQPIKPDGSDYKKALKNGSRRGDKKPEDFQTMHLEAESEIVLVASGSVGHPETGCPETGSSCNQTGQTNESWIVVIEGEQVAYYPDTADHQDVFLSHPNVYLTYPAGDYEVYIRHALDNSGHSVGAFLRVCTQ